MWNHTLVFSAPQCQLELAVAAAAGLKPHSRPQTSPGVAVLDHIHAVHMPKIHTRLCVCKCRAVHVLCCGFYLDMFLQGQGDFEGAEEVLRQSLAIHSHANGMHHPKTGQALHRLANCLASMQRFGLTKFVSWLLLCVSIRVSAQPCFCCVIHCKDSSSNAPPADLFCVHARHGNGSLVFGTILLCLNIFWLCL